MTLYLDLFDPILLFYNHGLAYIVNHYQHTLYKKLGEKENDIKNLDC